jgi:hypothetical protein
MAHGITLWGFDLDDIGSQHAQVFSRDRPHGGTTKIQRTNAS